MISKHYIVGYYISNSGLCTVRECLYKRNTRMSKYSTRTYMIIANDTAIPSQIWYRFEFNSGR